MEKPHQTKIEFEVKRYYDDPRCRFSLEVIKGENWKCTLCGFILSNNSKTAKNNKKNHRKNEQHIEAMKVAVRFKKDFDGIKYFFKVYWLKIVKTLRAF